MNTIKKIVLTGGPCAGKTTALVKVIEHFSSLGYKVFTIPEVPTLFTQSGMNYLTKNEKFFFEGEKATFLTQIGLEDSFTRMAETLNQLEGTLNLLLARTGIGKILHGLCCGIGCLEHLLLRFHLWNFEDSEGVAHVNVVALLDSQFYDAAWQLAGYSVF